MTVNLIEGDLFSTQDAIIAHGCNCSGGFGSGIAGLIKQKYPAVRRAYYAKYRNEGWRLGDIQPVFANDSLMIINCAIQQEYGRSPKLYADYEAIKESMFKVQEYAIANGIYSISIPKIGCGRGGANWDMVEFILEEIFTIVDVNVYYLGDEYECFPAN